MYIQVFVIWSIGLSLTNNTGSWNAEFPHTGPVINQLWSCVFKRLKNTYNELW